MTAPSSTPSPTLSPTPRRVKKPTWLDTRLMLGVLLVLGSLSLGARVVAGADRTYGLLAATHDAEPGTVLGAADVHLVRVKVPAHGRGLYTSEPAALIGKTLNRAVSRGELVPTAAVRDVGNLTTLTIPFAADAAPSLSSGQRITVWLTTKDCPPVVVLADAAVQAVHGDSGGTFATAGGQDVVVSVVPELAARVVTALAQDGGSLRAGRLTGSVDSGANDRLPDVACTPATNAGS